MIPRILDMLFLSAPHLAGDDVRQRSEERRRYRFSIHAALAGGDSIEAYDDNNSRVFLSTPPSRVATAKVYKNVQCLLRKREKLSVKSKII